MTTGHPVAEGEPVTGSGSEHVVGTTASRPENKVQRRSFVAGILLGSVGFSQVVRSDTATFDELLNVLQSSDDLVEHMRLKGDDPAEVGLERAPLRAPKSKTPISSRATELIIACEVSHKALYEKRYQAPVWPRGKSGVTIGIGYDIGYVTPNQLTQDWKGYTKAEVIDILADACGITGTSANDIIPQFKDFVRIDWASAIRQFSEEIRPRYIGETERSLPNCDKLNADSLGALVSLAYNRGASFQASGERYSEMRNIRTHMTVGDFSKISSEIRSMKRLWLGQSDMKGVVIRRDAEAALFEFGLSASK